MLIVFSSTISGYDTPEGMVEFAKLKFDWLRQFVPLESVPCSETLRFFICSINTAELIRSHWGVENNLHWQLDVTFKEDQCLLASGAVAMAVIKRFCMNLLKLKDTSKRRMKHRVMAAAIDDDYRTKILLSA